MLTNQSGKLRRFRIETRQREKCGASRFVMFAYDIALGFGKQQNRRAALRVGKECGAAGHACIARFPTQEPRRKVGRPTVAESSSARLASALKKSSHSFVLRKQCEPEIESVSLNAETRSRFLEGNAQLRVGMQNHQVVSTREHSTKRSSL